MTATTVHPAIRVKMAHTIEMDFRNQYGTRVLVMTCPESRETLVAVKGDEWRMVCPFCGAQA
jgi:hypothetical protein